MHRELEGGGRDVPNPSVNSHSLFSFQISRIQQETLGGGRTIPDKPPPPYTPPASPIRLAKPVPAKPVEKFVPSSKTEILELVSPMAKALYKAKSLQLPLPSEEAPLPEGLVKESDHESRKKFVSFLSKLVREIFDGVYRCESEVQNPPWMPQKSMAKERMNLPGSENELIDRVGKEALIFFGFEKRSQKENLIVRWAQKRRDRVDQVRDKMPRYSHVNRLSEKICHFR